MQLPLQVILLLCLLNNKAVQLCQLIDRLPVCYTNTLMHRFICRIIGAQLLNIREILLIYS